MFETQDAAEVLFPDAFSDQGVRAWWYIQQRLHTHWFHVTYQERYEEDGEEMLLNRLILFSIHEHLIQFSNLPEHKIEHVYIITPKYLNGSTNWKMEPLKEIWEAEEPEQEGQAAHIFFLENDKKYVDSGLNTHVEKLINKNRIFCIS